jgi:hypothetical protein
MTWSMRCNITPRNCSCFSAPGTSGGLTPAELNALRPLAAEPADEQAAEPADALTSLPPHLCRSHPAGAGDSRAHVDGSGPATTAAAALVSAPAHARSPTRACTGVRATSRERRGVTDPDHRGILRRPRRLAPRTFGPRRTGQAARPNTRHRVPDPGAGRDDPGRGQAAASRAAQHAGHPASGLVPRLGHSTGQRSRGAAGRLPACRPGSTADGATGPRHLHGRRTPRRCHHESTLCGAGREGPGPVDPARYFGPLAIRCIPQRQAGAHEHRPPSHRHRARHADRGADAGPAIGRERRITPRRTHNARSQPPRNSGRP